MFRNYRPEGRINLQFIWYGTHPEALDDHAHMGMYR